MSILTDIRTAAENYATDHITTFVANLSSPIVQGGQFTFDIGASNGKPLEPNLDIIAVINVRYHLTASGADIQLVVPPETVAIARDGSTETGNQLTPGTLVTSMFLFPITPDGIALGIADGDTIRGLTGQAGPSAVVGDLGVDAHADLDSAKLFPNERINPRVTETINVV